MDKEIKKSQLVNKMMEVYKNANTDCHQKAHENKKNKKRTRVEQGIPTFTYVSRHSQVIRIQVIEYSHFCEKSKKRHCKSFASHL